MKELVRAAATVNIDSADDVMFAAKAVTYIPFAFRYSDEGLQFLLELVSLGRSPQSIAALTALSGCSLGISESNRPEGVLVYCSLDPSDDNMSGDLVLASPGYFLRCESYRRSEVVEQAMNFVENARSPTDLAEGMVAMLRVDFITCQDVLIEMIRSNQLHADALWRMTSRLLPLSSGEGHNIDGVAQALCDRIVAGETLDHHGNDFQEPALRVLAEGIGRCTYPISEVLECISSSDRASACFAHLAVQQCKSSKGEERQRAIGQLLRIVQSSNEPARQQVVASARSMKLPDVITALRRVGALSD